MWKKKGVRNFLLVNQLLRNNITSDSTIIRCKLLPAIEEIYDGGEVLVITVEI